MRTSTLRSVSTPGKNAGRHGVAKIAAFVVALIALPITFTPMASAGDALNQHISTGGGPGATFRDCADVSSTVLTGVSSGIWVTDPSDGNSYMSQLAGLCDSSGTLLPKSGTPPTVTYWGNNTPTTAPTSQSCASGKAVVGARVFQNGTGGLVSGIQLVCGWLPDGTGTSSSTTLGVATATYEDLACATGTVAIGLYVSAGDVIDRFGFRCDAQSASSLAVTVTAGTGGTASASSTSVVSGGSVTLSAVPDAGYAFSSWTCSQGTLSAADANPATLSNITANASCTASFMLSGGDDDAADGKKLGHEPKNSGDRGNTSPSSGNGKKVGNNDKAVR